MNWTIILIFSVMGVLNIDTNTFFHALLIGLAWGILNGLIQSSFFDLYLSNNPGLAERFKQSTFVKGKWLVLITGPMMGLLIGAVTGGMALLIKKLF